MIMLFKGALGGGLSSIWSVLGLLILIAVVIILIRSIVISGFLFFSSTKCFMNECDALADQLNHPREITKLAYISTILAGLALCILIIVLTVYYDCLSWVGYLFPFAYIIGMIKFWDWWSYHVIDVGVRKAKKELQILSIVAAVVTIVSIVLIIYIL